MNNERYASVWDAIEDTPGAAENMKVRSALMHELVTYIANTGMTQAKPLVSSALPSPASPTSPEARSTCSASTPSSTCSPPPASNSISTSARRAEPEPSSGPSRRWAHPWPAPRPHRIPKF
jgi:predicted XRE-type DNA-binding protein